MTADLDKILLRLDVRIAAYAKACHLFNGIVGLLGWGLSFRLMKEGKNTEAPAAHQSH